jgi:hypothetical protein
LAVVAWSVLGYSAFGHERVTSLSELSRTIKQALRLVESDTRGHLPRPTRVALLRNLGHYVSGGATPPTAGHCIRARVAIGCVRAILPAWIEFLPADTMPERTLDTAEALLRGEIDKTAAVRARHAILQHADAVEAEHWDRTHDFRIVTCRAAHQALCVALWDEWLEGEEGFPVDAEDDKLDPFDYETAYLVSVVVAGGYLLTADVGRRRAFWTRYLVEIIPAVLAAEPSAAPAGGGTKRKPSSRRPRRGR